MTSTLRALTRGVLAGAAGTAAMTAAQTAYLNARGEEPSRTPAEVGRRIVEGVLQREVPEEWMGALNNIMHWLYGTSWGALFDFGFHLVYGLGVATAYAVLDR
jgi:hypothetical protein